jgi:hypothetical protein
MFCYDEIHWPPRNGTRLLSVSLAGTMFFLPSRTSAGLAQPYTFPEIERSILWIRSR